ncbi:MAG TPA: NAD(P)-dependent oxidoreductase [Acidimicrobiales bacterium]|nr:NAD(P)-dependent oxidoreductase [Acidimicrobiales bacterium]
MGDGLVITHRVGAASGMAQRLAELGVDATIVAWPEPGRVLLTFDYPWRDGERHLPDEVEWVHILGAGVGGFPFELLQGRPLTCSRGASAVPIAEWVLAVVLGFEKQVPESWLHEPPEAWNRASLGEVAGKTLALIGAGAIGTEVARRALAFDMRVVALRRSARPLRLEDVRVAESLHDAVRDADHVVIAAPATPETRHLIDKEALAQMKDGVHLVNIARGSLVDQDALLEALDSGKVARASLDVVDPEPLPGGHPLYTHPKVRLTPHISWSSPATMPRTMEIFLDNLRRFRNGEPLQGLVDVDAGY